MPNSYTNACRTGGASRADARSCGTGAPGASPSVGLVNLSTASGVTSAALLMVLRPLARRQGPPPPPFRKPKDGYGAEPLAASAGPWGARFSALPWSASPRTACSSGERWVLLRRAMVTMLARVHRRACLARLLSPCCAREAWPPAGGSIADPQPQQSPQELAACSCSACSTGAARCASWQSCGRGMATVAPPAASTSSDLHAAEVDPQAPQRGARRSSQAQHQHHRPPEDWTQHTRTQFSIRPSLLSPLYSTYQGERRKEQRRQLISNLLDAHMLLSSEVDGLDAVQVGAREPWGQGRLCARQPAARPAHLSLAGCLVTRTPRRDLDACSGGEDGAAPRRLAAAAVARPALPVHPADQRGAVRLQARHAGLLLAHGEAAGVQPGGGGGGGGQQRRRGGRRPLAGPAAGRGRARAGGRRAALPRRGQRQGVGVGRLAHAVRGEVRRGRLRAKPQRKRSLAMGTGRHRPDCTHTCALCCASAGTRPPRRSPRWTKSTSTTSHPPPPPPPRRQPAAPAARSSPAPGREAACRSTSWTPTTAPRRRRRRPRRRACSASSSWWRWPAASWALTRARAWTCWARCWPRASASPAWRG